MNNEIDTLDEIYSQRANFLSRTRQELLRAQRYLNFLSFVRIDTKTLNAAHDSKTANPDIEVYRKLKHHIRSSIRQTDIISGFNAGTICVLLIEANKEGVELVKDRLQESLRYFLHEVFDSAMNWRVSISTGSFPDVDNTPNSFYAKLDAALADSKSTE
jgi:diguanylate cyclase (GGDEF)-like protein